MNKGTHQIICQKDSDQVKTCSFLKGPKLTELVVASETMIVFPNQRTNIFYFHITFPFLVPIQILPVKLVAIKLIVLVTISVLGIASFHY